MRIHAIRAHAHSGGGHEAIARTDGLIWICQQQHHNWIEAFLVSHREVRGADQHREVRGADQHREVRGADQHREVRGADQHQAMAGTLDTRQLDGFELPTLKETGHDGAMSTQTDLGWADCTAVERDPQRVSGAWVFRGTRIPVAALFENLEDGVSLAEFVELFPGVSQEQARSVLEHAARSTAAAVA